MVFTEELEPSGFSQDHIIEDVLRQATPLTVIEECSHKSLTVPEEGGTETKTEKAVRECPVREIERDNVSAVDKSLIWRNEGRVRGQQGPRVS